MESSENTKQSKKNLIVMMIWLAATVSFCGTVTCFSRSETDHDIRIWFPQNATLKNLKDREILTITSIEPSGTVNYIPFNEFQNKYGDHDISVYITTFKGYLMKVHYSVKDGDDVRVSEAPSICQNPLQKIRIDRVIDYPVQGGVLNTAILWIERTPNRNVVAIVIALWFFLSIPIARKATSIRIFRF